MKRPEQLLHQQVAAYLNAALTAQSWWMTIPLGGGGAKRGAILYGMGAKAGAPDILIQHDGRATWIELKAAKGILSGVQRACHAAIERAGGNVYVCRSVAEVQDALEYARIPTRAKVTA